MSLQLTLRLSKRVATLVAALAIAFATVAPAAADDAAPTLGASAVNLWVQTSPSELHSVGQVVTIVYNIQNLSGAVLSDITFTTTRTEASGTHSAVVCPKPTLGVGAVMYCRGTYVAAAADLDGLPRESTYQVSAKDPAGATVTAETRSWFFVNAAAQDVDASLSQAVTETSAPVHYADQQVTFTVKATNTGSVPLHSAAFNLLGTSSGSNVLYDCDGDPDVFGPGESITCKLRYVVTPADVKAGSFTMLSTVRAHALGGEFDAAPAETTVTVTPKKAPLQLTQRVSHREVDFDIRTNSYTFTVTNVSSGRVRGLAIKQNVSGHGQVTNAVCGATELAPGTSTTCKSSYRIHDDDYLEEAPVTNVAAAFGTLRLNAKAESAPTKTDFYVDWAGSLLAGSMLGQVPAPGVGTKVVLTYAVKNAKSRGLRNVTARATSTGSGMLSTFACLETTLLPGEVTTCTATYTVTEADLLTLDFVKVTGYVFAMDSTGARLRSNPVPDSLDMHPVEQ